MQTWGSQLWGPNVGPWPFTSQRCFKSPPSAMWYASYCGYQGVELPLQLLLIRSAESGDGGQQEAPAMGNRAQEGPWRPWRKRGEVPGRDPVCKRFRVRGRERVCLRVWRKGVAGGQDERGERRDRR